MTSGLYYLTADVSFPAILIKHLESPGAFIVYFDEIASVRVACEVSDTPAPGVFVPDS